MRKTFLCMVFGFLMGFLLGHMGFSVLTWEWWAAMLLMCGYGFNLAIKE